MSTLRGSPQALSGLAACAALLGDLTAAQRALVEQRTLPLLAPAFLSAGEKRLGEAWRSATRGRLTEACDLLTQAARSARETGHLTGEALLLTDVARLGGAKDVADRLGELASASDSVFVFARAGLAAGLAGNDPDQLIAAARGLEAIGADLLAAEAAAAAAIYRRTGQIRQATAASRRAQASVAHCDGARTPLLADLEAGVTLTPREREIALLVADSTASKDIATTLHLSVRTVDNHLQHVYTKLGVTTRRQLADALGVDTNRNPAR
ncbi:helix-turn-helix transcriptional regulator [Streptomyces sp. NPDC005574]|uniref:helix-turn-helix transcriptional regulator n=1 Tax=Streptomyces sp. NPDC005574 TaxID=3156891 RepID=UPI0033ABFE04